ncbi:hypothetical protein AWB95_12605 [Mycobacterium celatum]|uniref:SHOCT domain-containing protein n=1 Tax=Mycobacterium celatum TaxID=28045 RepID=A0A1X1RR36_MYCCE|nr:SHOCT domain-containing protein [Mycobacterium celatum]ORV12732.1 hypothetical protein AWB95_12605 [Mycobacterium celatum]
MLFGIALLSLVWTAWWSGRSQSSKRQTEPIAAYSPADPYAAGDEGIKLEQLKTLSALRDSGALTEEEFQAEKRRILQGR